MSAEPGQQTCDRCGYPVLPWARSMICAPCEREDKQAADRAAKSGDVK